MKKNLSPQITREEVDAKAFSMIQELKLPELIQLQNQINFLGNKIAKFSKEIYDQLHSVHGDKLPKIIAIAVHQYWYSCCWNAAFDWFEVDIGEGNKDASAYEDATPIVAAESREWADTAIDGLSSSPANLKVEYFKKKFDCEVLDLDSSLKSLALYWLHQADIEMGKGNSKQSFDLIHEAYSVMARREGIEDWYTGKEFGSSQSKTEQAIKSATVRHRDDPKRKEKQIIFECWNDWQSKPYKYRTKAEFARTMLVTCKHLSSQKKIEDWCREWGAKKP